MNIRSLVTGRRFRLALACSTAMAGAVLLASPGQSDLPDTWIVQATIGTVTAATAEAQWQDWHSIAVGAELGEQDMIKTGPGACG